MIHVEHREGKDYVFCPFRRKWVRLTPEEEVRQRFLLVLVEEYRYPASRVAVEAALPSGQRADAVVYDRCLQPVMLIEFKAPSVALTGQTLDQAAVYNRMLHVPLLVLHNGTQTVVAKVDADTIVFLSDIPEYGENN
ncbi:MAG: type I restriction enzyme HsdR N-terminal domain-containing protein [Paludibacteraceae bacterium]|nr:type I restriction enzyme HsdR N-terminal domain-containing protein [Paludibacteraceae bacterium]